MITKIFCREESGNLSIQRCEFGVDCPGLLGERAGDSLHCELQPDRKYFPISQSHRLAGETGLCENVSCFVVIRTSSHKPISRKAEDENNGLLELFARQPFTLLTWRSTPWLSLMPPMVASLKYAILIWQPNWIRWPKAYAGQSGQSPVILQFMNMSCQARVASMQTVVHQW